MSRSRFIPTPRSVLVPAAVALLAAAGWATSTSADASTMSTASFLSSLGPPKQVASTVPANGDVNPYGVAMVASSTGKLVKGDILVSNFNDKANVQGTGKSIV